MTTSSPIHSALLNSRAAFDLASVMVGVVVIGILGGVIAATVFAVIPWAQDNAAKASLGSIYSAQSSIAGMRGVYADGGELDEAGLLPSTENIAIAAGSARDCYVAVSRSVTGTVFYNTDFKQEPQQYTAGSTADCAGVSLEQLVDSL